MAFGLKTSGFVACAAIALAGAVMVGSADADRTLARSYGRNLAESDAAWSRDTRPDNIWLSRTGDANVPIRQAVAVGDHVSIGRNGEAQGYQVVSVDQIDGDPMGLHGLRIQVVTARPDGGAGGQTVRFLFAIDGAAASPTVAKPDKVL